MASLGGLHSAVSYNSADFDPLAYNASVVQEERAYNSAEAQKNRDWYTEMSNTAHQREVADLIKAGLNPIYSANGGASVSSMPTAVSSSRQAMDSKGDMMNATSNRISSIAAVVGASAQVLNSVSNMIGNFTVKKSINKSFVQQVK